MPWRGSRDAAASTAAHRRSDRPRIMSQPTEQLEQIARRQQADIDEVARVANDTYVLARAAGRSDLAEALAADARRWRHASATVVVAGAQKRGKSRLINSLLRQRDLLPVAVDIATSTHILVRHGEQFQVTAV